MSIKHLDNSMLPRPAQSTSVKDQLQSRPGAIAFGGLLETEDKQRSAAAVAQILRMQMMRSMLTLDDDAESPGPGGMGQDFLMALQNHLAPSSQKNDTLPVPPPLLADPPRISELPMAPEQSRGLNLYRRQSTGFIESIVQKASRQHDLDPALVKAVIRAESDFDPRSVSPVGAKGLMQLMPGTAKDLGVSDPFDPEQNVMGGSRYLRQMLDRYDGDLDSALAAYNWGPGNFDRNNRNLSRLPEETRTYIARIRRFLGEEA